MGLTKLNPCYGNFMRIHRSMDLGYVPCLDKPRQVTVEVGHVHVMSTIKTLRH